MKQFQIGAILLLTLVLTNCASIISGGPHKLNVYSQPDKAKIQIYNNNNNLVIWNGETPATALLNRGDGFFKGASYRVEISKQGYQTQNIFITPSLNGWYIANILFGGLIGILIVDPLTGAMWVLNPENVNVSLNSSTSYNFDKDGIKVVLREDISEKDFSQLKLTRVN